MNGRRLFPILIATALTTVFMAADAGGTLAQADSSKPSVRKNSSAFSSRKSVRPSQSRAVRLAKLYDVLAKAPNAELAKLVEARIEATRQQSGSATADLLLARARASMEAKDNKLALELLDAVVDLAPTFVEARAQRATLYYENKDIVRSLADLRVIVAQDPKHYNALTGLGIIFQEIGEDKLALEAFRRALKVDPYIEGVEEFVKKLEPKVEGRDI
jgi:tetratricopeptide (TPR) repeat protein